MNQSITSILYWPWSLSLLGRRKPPARADEPPSIETPCVATPGRRRSHPLWIIDYVEGTVWCEPPG